MLIKAIIIFVTIVFFAVDAPPSANAEPAQHASLAPVQPEDAHRYETDSVARLARGVFLAASPGAKDKRFAETVVLMIEYGFQGAVGIVINRPTGIPLADALPDIDDIKKLSGGLYYGGPVDKAHVMLLIRSDHDVPGAQKIINNVYVSADVNVLKRAASEATAEDRLRIYAGYAGWAPQQLEREVFSGGWHVIDANADAIFSNEPGKVWSEIRK